KTLSPKQITQQIEQLKNVGTQLLDNYKNLSQLDEEQLKTSLYKNSLQSSLMKGFSWTKESKVLKDNPIYEAEMKRLNYELEVGKFQWNKAKDQMDFALRKSKQDAELQSGGTSTISTVLNTPETEGMK